MTRKHGERTRSRSSLTLALQRVAARIASQQVYAIEWSDRILPESQSSRIRVEALWVAGSYARGAVDCGDLDLVVNVVSEEGALPWRTALSRTLIGRAPDVRLYSGTPENNSSGVSFPEAKLVWSPAQPDWQAAISTMAVDPSAARYSRRTDALPVRTEQLYQSNPAALEELVDLKLNQVIDWIWLPTEQINVRPETWSADAREFADRVSHWSGKKTQAVMQFVIQHYEQAGNYTVWHKDIPSDRSRFRVAGAQIFVGRPPVQVELLSEISCSSLVVAPHLSRRGPNGLWIISRGPNHPIEKTFHGKTLYYLKTGQCPLITEESEDWRRIYSLELFRSPKAAKKAAAERQVDIAIATESDLLKLISAFDVIEIGAARLAITWDGMFFDEATEVANADALLAFIDPIRK